MNAICYGNQTVAVIVVWFADEVRHGAFGVRVVPALSVRYMERAGDGPEKVRSPGKDSASLQSSMSTCAQCDTTFAYTSAEQVFRRDHNLPRPVLCPTCRAAQRTARHSELRAPAERESVAGYGGRARDSTPRRRGGGTEQSAGGRSYPATCATCGAGTRVPFVPSPDRPVYCRECFNARRGR